MTPVAIVGTGAVGVAIATSLRRGGVDAVLVSRDPRATTVTDIPVVSFDDLAADTDTFIIAVPGPAVEELLSTRGSRLAGHLLIDATNNVGAASYSQLPLFEMHTPTARVARAWCTLGWENFLDPEIDGVALDLAWCGPDGVDGDHITSLITATGLRPVRVGDLSKDHILEYVTRLTLSLIFETGRSRNLGIKILEGPNFS